MEKRDFFISYTKADKAEAEWIAQTLIRYGYTVYIQTRDIAPGNNFMEKMERFLENAESFIAVWSRNYPRSDFAMMEFRAALRACLASRRARSARHLFRHTSLFCLEIHPVFLRQNALSGKKSAARPAHCGIQNRLLKDFP